jgi:hypothetical protein
LVSKIETVICDVVSGFSGEVGWPDELALLPRKGLLADRTRFIGKALLGHTFLPGGFLAEYNLGASESTLFLSKLSSPEEAAHAFNRLRSFELERGEVMGSCEIGESCIQVKDSGLGHGVVLSRGSFVGGMWRIQQYSAVLDTLQELDRNLVLGEGAQELATDSDQDP